MSLRRGWKIFFADTGAFVFHDELSIGTTAGVLCYQNGNFETFNELAGKPFGDVRAMAQDKAGAIWFGTAGGGLVCLRDGSFHRFQKSDGLSSDFIECLHFAEDGALWVGTFGGGLNRLKDGQFSVVNQEQGLPSGVIGHIEADGRGYFWMSSYGGILRANESDLNRCADGKLAKVAISDLRRPRWNADAGMFGRLAARGRQNGRRTAVVSHGQGAGCGGPGGRHD